MMRVGGAWLEEPGTQGLLAVLCEGGHQAYVVGGCVRNALFGVPVVDVDIATDARPERVRALCEAAGWRVVPTGIEHGTLTVVIEGTGHEVTTFRRDVDTDGRRAVIAFSESVEEDARRRDFTMNALYARSDGALLDPVGGLADIAARRVRFIGHAEDRIREDYLRILRFFRFHALYGDRAAGMDAEGLAAAATHARGIERLSPERVGTEMRRLLAAPDPAPAMAAMAATGVLSHVLPGADSARLVALVQHEAVAGMTPDALRRMALIGGEDPAGRFRLSRAESRRLDRLRSLAAASGPVAVDAYRAGAPAAIDAALVRAARNGTPLPDKLHAEARRGAAARFPLRAADLMPQMRGAALGRALAAAEAAWLGADFGLGRDELIAIARDEAATAADRPRG